MKSWFSGGALWPILSIAWDTQKRLRDSGVPQNQAEAHAEAARDFIMAELATKADVLAVRTDLLATEQRLQASMDTLSLRLTVRLGTMLVVGIVALATVLKLV
jgi:hypothetical protein